MIGPLAALWLAASGQVVTVDGPEIRVTLAAQAPDGARFHVFRPAEPFSLGERFYSGILRIERRADDGGAFAVVEEGHAGPGYLLEAIPPPHREDEIPTRVLRALTRYGGTVNEVTTGGGVVSNGTGDGYEITTAEFRFRPMHRWLHVLRFGAQSANGYVPGDGASPGEGARAGAKASFLYGFGEWESEPLSHVYVAPSLHVGLATGGPGAGPGLRVRLGPERRTHFQIEGVAPAAASRRPIGSHVTMQHAVWPTERLKITTGFGWEAHPEGRDAAVRVFTGAALDVNELVSVELRSGWGGRSVEPVRMGPSAELRLTFRWDTGVWAEASEIVE